MSSRTLSARHEEAVGTGPRICLFGAAPDSGNHGVSALMLATVDGLSRRHADAVITVFDNGLGARRRTFVVGDRTVAVDCIGFRGGRRYNRPENQLTTRVAARAGGLGNPGAAAVLSADVVLDLTAGDSFTDLYGRERFATTAAGKRLALAAGRPLVLLPQTYGPFRHRRTLHRATALLRGATAAWARGADSHRQMVRMLGPHHDPARHHLGVDMAFTLPPTPPGPTVMAQVERTLGMVPGAPVAGVNVSGLLYGRPDAGQRYGLAVDYDRTVRGIVVGLLDAGATVLLVPHVRNDIAACHALAADVHDRRLVVAPPELGAAETKWLIGRTDFFCGTRMHATIAALTSSVPTCAIAYSPKTAEVFRTLGVADRVVDARRDGTEDVVAAVLQGWEERRAIRTVLQRSVPVAVGHAVAQRDAILDVVDRLVGAGS